MEWCRGYGKDEINAFRTGEFGIELGDKRIHISWFIIRFEAFTFIRDSLNFNFFSEATDFRFGWGIVNAYLKIETSVSLKEWASYNGPWIEENLVTRKSSLGSRIGVLGLGIYFEEQNSAFASKMTVCFNYKRCNAVNFIINLNSVLFCNYFFG